MDGHGVRNHSRWGVSLAGEDRRTSVEVALQMLLTGRWDEIWPTLDAIQRDALSRSVRALALAGGDDKAFSMAALELIGVLRNVLPKEDTIRRTTERSVRLIAAPLSDWQPVFFSALSRRITQLVRQEVRGRLIDAAAFSATQVRARGEDPDQPFLIRLDPGTGDVQFPAFQFGPEGRAIGVVLAVNQRLGADEDPWGAADWWLGENAWLDAVPADLIGRSDRSLIAAADALAQPVGW